ncbi:MAG: nucleotidyl transferase AbiEii/AbiGii toxin family protein [Pirellulales bacterium]
MVKGVDLFREHFSSFPDHYVLIGGTACDLIMNNVGLSFRATKDLDIVLCVEALDAAFATAFWQFVDAGQYQIQETATGEKKFYRFQKPANATYPAMLELFSRVPDALSIADDSHLTPIPVDGEVSSLSAILLDEDYYGWIHAGKQEVEGVRIVGPEHLVPLKAKAWLDLRARKSAGHDIDSKSIKKHRNDVFRLFQVLDPEANLSPPVTIVNDMRDFLEQASTEEVDLKALGLGTRSLTSVIGILKNLYHID